MPTGPCILIAVLGCAAEPRVAPPAPERPRVVAVPADAPAVPLDCPVQVSEPLAGPVTLSVRIPDPHAPFAVARVVAQIADGRLTADIPAHNLNLAEFSAPGFPPGEVVWNDTGCALIDLQTLATVWGTVRNVLGTTSRVRGCGASTWTWPNGRFYLDAVGPGPCEIHAERTESRRTISSPPVTVSPSEDAPPDVQLLLPDRPWADLGLRVISVEDGLEIVAVAKGSGAEAAGLRPGDHIRAVDGEPATAITPSHFERRSAGLAGHVTVLEIQSATLSAEIPVERIAPSR